MANNLYPILDVSPPPVTGWGRQEPVILEHNLWGSAFHLIHPNQDVSDFSTPPDASYKYDWVKDKEELPHNIKLANIGAEYAFECYPDLTNWELCISCKDRESGNIKKPMNCDSTGIHQLDALHLVASKTCSSFSGDSDFDSSLVRNIEYKRSKAIEGHLFGKVDLPPWSGAISGFAGGVNPYTGENILLSPSAVSPKTGLAMLENALGECLGDQLGMIHFPIIPSHEILDNIDCHTVIYNDNMGPRNLLRTKSRHNIVIVGSGYNQILGPGGEVPTTNEVFIYATSMIYLLWDNIKITPDNLSESLDRRNNTITKRAEQAIFPLYNPCCVFAVKVKVDIPS